MREVLINIASRLGYAPTEAEVLVAQRGEVCDALHRALDTMEEREVEVAGAVATERKADKLVYANEATRNAEVSRRLAADEKYQDSMKEADRYRREMKSLEARIEGVSRRHESDTHMASLVASLLKAGRTEDAEAALSAYGATADRSETDAEAVQNTEPAPEAQGETARLAEQEEQKGNDGQGGGTFEVLETRPGRSADTVRAYCVSKETGEKVAIYAKNGHGKVLMSAIGKTVAVKYIHGDKGLIATSASIVN